MAFKKKATVEKVDEQVVEVTEPVFEEVVVTPVAEEAPVVEEASVEKPKVSKALKEIKSFELKMKLHTQQVISLEPGCKKVVVDNLGDGELYVGTSHVSYLREFAVTKGSSKTFEGVTSIVLKSANRPVVRITQFA